MDRNENCVHLGYQLINLFVRCSFLYVNYFSVSRLFPLPIASIVQT